MVMNTNIQLSFGKGVKSNAIKESPVKSWSEWVDALSDHREGAKDGGWALCGFCDGTRAAENLSKCGLFVIDGDSSTDVSVEGAPTVSSIAGALESMGIEALVTTTHSHQRDDKGNRWRAWIPTSREYDRRELAALSAGVHATVQSLGCNVAEVAESHRYAQLWFTPRHAKGAPFEVVHVQGGNLLDVDAMLAVSGLDVVSAVGDAPAWLRSADSVDGVECVVEGTEGRTIAERYCGVVDGSELLAEAGYEQTAAGRWLRPNSTSGLAGCVEYFDETRGRKVWKEFGGGGALATGLIHDAFGLLQLLKCDGDLDSAMVAAAGVVAADTAECATVVNEGKVKLSTLSLRTNGIMGKGGAVKRNERNASIILESAPAFRTSAGLPVLGYDTFERKVKVSEEFVRSIHPEGSRVVEYPQIVMRISMLIDEIVSDYECQHFGKTSVGVWNPKMIEQVMEFVAKQNTFDPLRDWVESLPVWDGVPRVETFMHRMLGVADDLYHRACMRKFLCGAVARAREGGVDFQLVPVLIGRQGLGKSPVMRTLFGAHWYSDAHLDIGNSLGVIAATSGKWVMEAAEQLNRGVVSNEAYKAFVSARADRARRMYGADEVVVPRRFVWYSTSNNIDFGVITDRTGGKRILPMHCHKQMAQEDFDWLEENREQIFSEAKLMLDKGEKLYMDGAAAAVALDVQSAEMVHSRWHDDIEAFLFVEDGDAELRLGSKGYPLLDAHVKRSQRAGSACTLEIYNHLVDCGLVEGIMSEKEKVDIESSLVRLGWHTLKKGQTGYMQRFDGLGSKRAWFNESEYRARLGLV